MNNHEEVAKKLRKICDENGGFFLTSDNAIYEIGKAIGAQGKPYKFFFNRLADLIDPTCHLLRVNDGDGIKYTCSNCGQFHVKDLRLLNGFKCCPVCRARIERNE